MGSMNPIGGGQIYIQHKSKKENLVTKVITNQGLQGTNMHHSLLVIIAWLLLFCRAFRQRPVTGVNDSC